MKEMVSEKIWSMLNSKKTIKEISDGIGKKVDQKFIKAACVDHFVIYHITPDEFSRRIGNLVVGEHGGRGTKLGKFIRAGKNGVVAIAARRFGVNKPMPGEEFEFNEVIVEGEIMWLMRKKEDANHRVLTISVVRQ